MKQLLTVVLSLFCLVISADNAEIPDMKFRRLDTRDGLSNSQINCLFQDSKGYVWIGTSYGLNRYDGYRFRTFYSDPSDTTSLRSNYVDMIMEDGDGRFWLKQGMNFSIFDPNTEKTVRNPSQELSKIGIKGGVDRLFIDSKKNLWVKNYDEGFYFYNPKTGAKTLTRYGYGEDEIPKEFWVSSYAEYDNKLIVASSNGELLAIDGGRGKVVWRDDYMKKNGGQTNSEYRINIDDFGNFWVLSNGVVYIFNSQHKRWYNSINDYFRQFGVKELPENTMVWDVIMDHRHWIWLATDHQGLYVVDWERKELRQFLNNKYDETSLSENTIKHLLLDKSGNMWIGAYRSGLNQFIENLSGFSTLEIGDVNTTTEDTHGNYWFGTDNRGIIKYNPKTGETEVFDRARCGFQSDIMVSSCSSRDGSVWFGTYNGGLIHIVNGHAYNYTATTDEGGLLNNNVWSVIEDKWGDIWIGTLGNGVQRLRVKTGKFQTWSSYNTELPSNFMTSLAWIKKGWLMAGHSEYYSLINPVSGQVMNFKIPAVPDQPAAMPAACSVIEDSRGLIWYGSSSGCCIIDRKTQQQTMLDMNSGLFGSSVVGLVEDDRHTVWVVTEHGISSVIPRMDEEGKWSFLVRSFSTKDGLQQGTYNQRSISLTRNGIVLVGGIGGVDVINPRLVSNEGSKEHPIFSGLKLFGQQIGVGQEYEGRVILEEALDTSRELELRYYENQFTIQLASDKAEIHNTSRFVYMLEGFSDKWIKTEENDPNITYMSLHHGSYLLHVRMLNDDGTMGEHEAVLEITITPPLLRNRWLMVFFLALVVGGIYLWRRRFLQKHAEQVELDQIRMEAYKKQIMTEMRAQMQESMANEQKPKEPQVNEWEVGALNRQPADLQDFMKDQCAKFKAPDDKRLRFSFFPLAQDLVMPFDQDMMGQAIQILLNNCVMFSPKDCRIKVFVDKTPNMGTIRISDNGIGLDEDAKEHMFDPMVSDDDSGICLSIVKDIVTAHGGTVVGDNNPGGGSVYTISLPLEEEVVEEAVLMDDETNDDEINN